MACFNSKVSKDIAVVQKELTQHEPNVMVGHSTETDSMPPLSTEQIGEFVQIALEKYLSGYDFSETGGLLTERNIRSARNLAIMQVAREIVVSLNPDPTGTKLAYGLFSTKFELTHSGVRPPNSTIFVYQWSENGRTYLTSPYFTPTTTDGTTVPCAKPRDITRALLESDPVPGIIQELKQLYSVDTDTRDNSLAGPDFEWNFHGAFPIAFNVMSSTRLYWEDVNGTSGEVKLTQNGVIGLLVKLTRIL